MTASRSRSDFIQELELGVATPAQPGTKEAFESFFSFFSERIGAARPDRPPPFLRVTLKCVREEPPNKEETGEPNGPCMRVFPFVDGAACTSFLVPGLENFYKICSIRGVPGNAVCHSNIQVAASAIELLSVRVFSCDFRPEELPPPPDPRLLLAGQRYASQEPVGTSGGDTGALEQTGENNRFACTAEEATSSFIGEERLDTRESERGHDNRSPEDSRAFSEVTDQNEALHERGDLYALGEETRAQQQQQQMILEGLLRAGSGRGGTLSGMQEGPQLQSSWGLREATQQSDACMSEASGSLRCNNSAELSRPSALGFLHQPQPQEPQQQQQQRQHRQRQDVDTTRDRSSVPPFIIRKRPNTARPSAPALPPPRPSASHLPHEPCTSTSSAPGGKRVKVEKPGNHQVYVKAEKNI